MENASSGHKLGRLIGDWFEEYFVYPLLKDVSLELDLFLDSRFIERNARDGRIIWEDLDGNVVDFDYVLEINGSDNHIGLPVAFIECFWRRGARHSKDKARDDSGKLMPMRDTYPTARFLGMVSAGNFTKPARELVKSREIDLFYIPKEKIVKAFEMSGLTMDYPDKLPESRKRKIADSFIRSFTKQKKEKVRDSLFDLVGKTAINSYIYRVRAILGALPQEIRLVLRQDSSPLVFETVVETTTFLENPKFDMNNPKESYLYQATFDNGSEFEKAVKSVEELKNLHNQIELLTTHMAEIIE